MELFGIVFSIPVAFGATALFCVFLNRLVKPRPGFSRILMVASAAVLCLWLVELMGVVIFGTTALNDTIGPAFYGIHLVLFFLAVPSLASILMLQSVSSSVAKWYVVAIPCTVLALIVVLLQYGVSEALYGID